MRVLVGAALVVGTLGDSHCENADCTACETDFAGCGGYTTSANWATAMEALATKTDKTDAETNCFNMGMDVAVAAAEGDQAACEGAGGTWAAGSDAWTPTYSAGVKTCNNTDGVAYDGATDADTVCTDAFAVVGITASWTDATGQCTVDGTPGAEGTNAADCNTDDANTSWVQATAATCLGQGAVETNIADLATCEGDNVTAEAAVVSPAVPTCKNAADEDVGNAASQELCEVEVDAVPSSCDGETNANPGEWSDNCTAVKAIACVTHYDLPANADCLATEDPAGSASPSADDPSGTSPASMLQVGAAVLASLAMLL